MYNNVRGMKILSAARWLATNLGITEFKGSDGWLWRFRNRHGLFYRVVKEEAGSANMSEVEPFRFKLQKLIEDESETGFFWRAMPKNSQGRKCEETTRGEKASKERVSVLVVANATGTHSLSLAVVGKAQTTQSSVSYNE